MTEHASLLSYKGNGGDIYGKMARDKNFHSPSGGGITSYEQDAILMEHDSLPPCGGGSGWRVIPKRWGRWVLAVWTLILALITLQLTMVFLGISIGINPTQSQPYRFFLILKKSPFARGDLIAFRFPGSEYYSEGSLFVKEVRGMPGDRLEMREDHTVWLNGGFLDTVKAADSRGKTVKASFFNGLIPEGHYFLYSSAPNSYDSRYYGLIGKERIVGKAIPLW